MMRTMAGAGEERHRRETRWPRGRGRDDGFVAGAEALIFGVLIFLVGTIIALNAWAVIDAKMAVTAAAREGARTAVDAPADAPLGPRVEQVTRAAIDAQGKDPAQLIGTPTVTGSVGRCAPITVEVQYRVVGIRVPWLGTIGSQAVEVGATHTQVVDPFRSGLAGEADTCGF